MALKPYLGSKKMVGRKTAGEAIPYYYLMKYHSTDKTKLLKATSGSTPVSVAVPMEESMMSDGAGGTVPRTQYISGEEIVEAYESGTLPVKLGETVVEGQKCVPGATAGLAYAQDEPTFTDAAIATHDDAKINTAINGLIDEIQAARASDASVFGEFVTGGDAGDIAFIKVP